MLGIYFGVESARKLTWACGVLCAGALLSTSAIAGCNSGNAGQTNLLNSDLCQANSSGPLSTAVGKGADALGARSSAFGHDSSARAMDSTAIGAFSGPPDAVPGATTIGALAGLAGSGRFSTAVGAGGGVYVGNATAALGDFSIAIGGGNGGSPFGKSLLGARSNYFLSIAIGTSAAADSDFGLALGFNAHAGSGLGPIGPIAIGPDAIATLTNSTALGRFSEATAEDATAIGSGSSANKKSSVALGSNSIANVNNTVSVGNKDVKRRIMNVAPGVAASDAVTLAQLQAAMGSISAGTPTATAASATTVSDSTAHILNALQKRMSDLEALVKSQERRIAQLEGRETASR